MGRIWIIKETGEVRQPKRGEWILDGTPLQFDFDEQQDCPILSLETFDRDPREPIRAVITKWQGKLPELTQNEAFADFVNACRKAIEGEEG